MPSENFVPIVAERIRANAQQFHDKAALVFPAEAGPARVLTYAEVYAEIEALAGGLAGAGLRRGDRTIVMIPVGPELIVTVLALLRIGAVPVVVDPGMGLRRMMHCYRMVGAVGFVGVPLAHIVRLLRPVTFRRVRIAVTCGRRWFWGGHTTRALAAGRLPAPDARATADDLIMISFTTGSTGPAKGVEITYGALVATVTEIQDLYGHTADDVCLATSLPFVFLHLLVGATTVMAPIDFGKVAVADPTVLAALIEDYQVTAMFGSPTLIDRLVRHLKSNAVGLPALRCLVTGGAPVPAETVKRLLTAVPHGRAIVTYGTTEATPITAIDCVELDTTQRMTETGHGVCVGRAVASVRLRVVCIDGATVTDVPAGAAGEIIVSGPTVSSRYAAPAEANAAMKIRDGDRLWHRTGDIGRLDEQGRLWFYGRAADTVRTADGPLHTARCEAVLDAHPAVRRVALVDAGPPGRPEPVVCVELMPDVPPDAQNRILGELAVLAAAVDVTRSLRRFVLHSGFPVDIRHNAKIDHPALARWAAGQRRRLRGLPDLGVRG